MPLHVVVNSDPDSDYSGAETLRCDDTEDGSYATIVLSNSVVAVSYRGVMCDGQPALSPLDDTLPEETKRMLTSIKRGEILDERMKSEPDEERIEQIERTVPTLTTIARGHTVKLRLPIPGCSDKSIDLGVVMGWLIH